MFARLSVLCLWLCGGAASEECSSTVCAGAASENCSSFAALEAESEALFLTAVKLCESPSARPLSVEVPAILRQVFATDFEQLLRREKHDQNVSFTILSLYGWTIFTDFDSSKHLKPKPWFVYYVFLIVSMKHGEEEWRRRRRRGRRTR